MSDPIFNRIELGDVAERSANSFVDGPFGSSLKSDEYTEAGVRLIQLQNIGVNEWHDSNQRFISEKKFQSLQRHGASPGDIAIAKMAEPVARACIVPDVSEQFVVVADCIRLRPDISRFVPSYIVKAINSRYSRLEAEKKAIGSTRVRINLSVLKTVGCLVPPYDYQAKIAEVLDTLDVAILGTEAVVAKLRAMKQGLLHDLLTRGIDANGDLRPPQPEAPHLYRQTPLGWLPKEWEPRDVFSVSSTVTSGSRDWARYYAEHGAVFVRIGNLTREHVNLRLGSLIYVRPPMNADGQRTSLEAGDVLVSITADLGIVGVIPEGFGEAYINQHIALVRPNANIINARFLGHFLASPASQNHLSKLNDAGAKAGLNLPTIRGLPVMLPERSEQDAIAEWLDEIDGQIAGTLAELAKLKSLKSGLMDDLLTGRVAVTPLL